MSRKKPLTERGVKRMIQRERAVGLEPEDEAARWLADKQPEPPRPKAASKSKALHRWRNSRP